MLTLPQTTGDTHGWGARKQDGDPRWAGNELVLREGSPANVLTYIDGALLVDLWPDIVLPQDICTA